jgi:biotin synthase
MSAGGPYGRLAQRVLQGHAITRTEALSIAQAPGYDMLSVLAAAFRIRRVHHGTAVRLHVLENAKNGRCPEDCGFCAQSIRFGSPGGEAPLASIEALIEGARRAAAAGAVTYCMATATRGPNTRVLRRICDAARRIKAEHPRLRLCASLGLLNPDDAAQLKSAGIDRYNHNLETAPERFLRLVSTHHFGDRVRTIQTARAAGMEGCCGGIIGLGESIEERVTLAFALRDLQVESVPINLLDPRPGTPLSDQPPLRPIDALLSLAMFRFALPRADLRVAAGRESVLRDMQPLALYIANSMFTDGYLTTEGATPARDLRLILDAGLRPAARTTP